MADVRARRVARSSIPTRHLRRIGVANQTTMLARESLAIADEVGDAIARARGDAGAGERLPQLRHDLQRDAGAAGRRARAARRAGVDVMVVIGGFNSSNTISLAALCAERVPTYHIESSAAIDPEARTIHYRVAQVKHDEADARDWLPRRARCASESRRARARPTTRSATSSRACSPRAGSASPSRRNSRVIEFARYIALGDSVSIDLYPALDAGEIDVAVALERDPSVGRVAPLGAASLLYQNAHDRWPEFAGDDLVSRFPASNSETSPPTGRRSATSSANRCRSSTRPTSRRW